MIKAWTFSKPFQHMNMLSSKPFYPPNFIPDLSAVFLSVHDAVLLIN